MAKGRAPLRGAPFGGAAAEEESDIARDVTINDAPPQTRYALTKRTTQEEIQRRTATVIVNRCCTPCGCAFLAQCHSSAQDGVMHIPRQQCSLLHTDTGVHLIQSHVVKNPRL